MHLLLSRDSILPILARMFSTFQRNARVVGGLLSAAFFSAASTSAMALPSMPSFLRNPNTSLYEGPEPEAPGFEGGPLVSVQGGG